MDAFRADRHLLAETLDVAAAAIEARFERSTKHGRRLRSGQSLVEHGRQLLVVLRELRRRAEADAVAAENQDETREKVAALRQLRRVVLVARHLEHALGWLDDKPERLGLGAAYVLREFAYRMIAEDADLIEEPADSPTYATLSWPFERLLSASDFSEELQRTRHPVLLYFPRSEAGNALLMPLLVHELGHPAWLQRGLGDELFDRLRGSDTWEAVDAALTQPTMLPEEAEVLFRRRLEELFCDALACSLLGPSYLLSYVGWAAAMGLAEARREHPPSVLRMGLMLVQLIEKGWEPALDAIPGVKGWLEGLLANELQLFRIDKATVAALRAAHSYVIELADKVAADQCFDPEVYEQQKAALHASLDDELLPAQLDHHGTWADRRALLLACWVHRIDDGGPERIARLLADRPYQSFVDKALEMSYVLEHWKTT